MTITYELRIQKSRGDTHCAGAGNNPGANYGFFGKTNATICKLFGRWLLGIPAGVTIEAAYVRMRASEDDALAFTAKIRCLTVADSQPDFDTSPCAKTPMAGEVSWSVPAFTQASYYNTPELKTIIQAFIDDVGYDETKYMAIRIDEGDAENNENRGVRMYDYSPDYPMLLHIEYTTGVPETELNYKVGAIHDDAQKVKNTFTNEDTIMKAAGIFFEFAESKHVRSWYRVLNVQVPKGATIIAAFFKPRANFFNAAQVPKTKIYGIDEGNTATFDADPDGRALTTASVDWDPVRWEHRVWRRSPNLKTIIQEIVNRGDWAKGNALGLKWDNDGSPVGNNYFADAYAYDWSAAFGAELQIVYQPKPGGGHAGRAKWQAILGFMTG